MFQNLVIFRSECTNPLLFISFRGGNEALHCVVALCFPWVSSLSIDKDTTHLFGKKTLSFFVVVLIFSFSFSFLKFR